MPAVFINMATVIIGGTLGTLFGSVISERYTKAVMCSIGFITLIIGVQSAIGTSSILLVTVFLVLGTLIGVSLKIDDRMNGAADYMKLKLKNTRLASGSFGEGFITTSILFCVGSMTVVGSIEAGLNGNYEIIIAKSVMDLVSATAFASALGAGVIFSALTVLVVQGGITLLAGAASGFLTTELVTEMSAVGGAMFLGMGFNLIGISDKKIKVGDMLPAIFLPLLYFPLRDWILSLM